MANEKGSPQQRKKRIAELEAEIDGLQRERPWHWARSQPPISRRGLYSE